MLRWARRVVAGLLLLALIVTTPIVYVEWTCSVAQDPALAARPPMVTAPGYVRAEADSYLSFPEWHIVYAYEDIAGVLATNDPSEVAYGRQITGFWRSLCRLTRLVTARATVPTDTKVMLYTIGWSFTAELALKGLYENTLGRFTEWLRGPHRTAEDEFVARDMQSYARFLHQTPWYAYPFAARLGEFWWTTPLRGEGIVRKVERRAIVTVEYGVKAVYGAVIGWASNTALGAADLDILSVVTGLDPADLAAEPSLKVVRELGNGRTLIRTPRYQAYTDLIGRLARRGRDVVEIAGRHRILMTVLAPRGGLPRLSAANALFEVPIQSRPDRRRIGLDVAVEQLAASIRTLEASGTIIEHIYDY
ncbi:MAG TPA: hypothetical protein VHT71_09240 [Methylomirabilota bacterium]|jgi:hypothetical protein|nr:hypothetical protein [Methylomirabilota bacterium]